ncbi:hypothetical protein C272_05079 [Brevibacterium casei S18]|uniref:DUF559 domain-containing protein n=3 Tax=Brevibacterium casei TaxID=33889 RepID=K9ALS2_9MICO|nr:hypothetical protein C272_05079 [Brevibacterium casei S18]KZE21576.1 hypothetical protein AVW13_08930 [Brevibacterium casei]
MRLRTFPSSPRTVTIGGMQGHFERRRTQRLYRSRDAADNGVTEWGLRNTEIAPRIIHGIRVAPGEFDVRRVPQWADTEWETTSESLRALQLIHPEIAASHASAARLFGLPLPRRLGDQLLHVATADRDQRIRRPGVVLHRTNDFAAATLLGHRIITPPVLFLQLATILTRDELVQAGDAMIGSWHGPPLCTADDIAAHFASRSVVRAGRTASAALELIRPGVDSPQETDLRLWAISVGLPEPEIHPAVWCRELGRDIHPDLGYERARLGLEYEGDHHRTDKHQWDDDIQRVNALAAEGWLIIRVNSRTNRARLERSIREHLAARGVL